MEKQSNTLRKPFAVLLAALLACTVCIPLGFADEAQSGASGEAANVNANASTNDGTAIKPTELPTKFDLRAVDYDGDGKDARCFVTPVRNQSPYGVCWGFATTAAAETSQALQLFG